MAGVIDSDSVGEMKVLPHDVSSQPVQLQAQERVAHVGIIPYRKGEWQQLPQAPDAATRGRGFGSTHMKTGAVVCARNVLTIGPGPQRLLLNTLPVTYTGQDNIEIRPTNQLFLWESRCFLGLLLG